MNADKYCRKINIYVFTVTISLNLNIFSSYTIKILQLFYLPLRT